MKWAVLPVNGARKIERPERETWLLASDPNRGLYLLFPMMSVMVQINDAAGKVR